MAHALNLLLQDWDLSQWANYVVKDAQKIVKFRRARHVLLVLFHKHVAIHAQGLSLLSPSVTRFAINFFMVARILDMKDMLKQTIIDLEWDTYARTLFNMQRKLVQTQAWELRRMVLSDDYEFWQSCANYCIVIKAIMAALKEFDGKQPCNVYIIMKALWHHVAILRIAPFNMPSHLVEPLEAALRNREAMIASDLQYVGAFFNPHFIKDMELCDDQYAMARLMRDIPKAL